MSNAHKKDVLALIGDFTGVSVTRTPSGSLTIDVSQLGSDLDIRLIAGGNVRLVAPAPEQSNGITAPVTKNAYSIGDVLADGWVVGPASPDTGIVMAIEPDSGALDGGRTWLAGEEHARELYGKGNANARQPSANELNAIYNGVVEAGRNQNAQFDTSDFDPYGGYWSSTSVRFFPAVSARVQYFRDGFRFWDFKVEGSARVRCVRDEPGLMLE
ncbi:MAG: hypothetical protein ABL907_14880 [Hyphomicrobium sp.]